MRTIWPSLALSQDSHTRKSKRLPAALVAVSLLVANTCFAATTVSVNFQGRQSGGTNGPTAPLGPTDVAGVVGAAHWNNINDDYGTGLTGWLSRNNADSVPLVDS